jgi:hypothetical protein
VQPAALVVGDERGQGSERMGTWSWLGCPPRLLDLRKRRVYGMPEESKEKHLTYIERNSCFNPINIQQICINICDACANNSSADIHADRKNSHGDIEGALGRFALQYQVFDQIIEQAELARGKDAAERKYKVAGVNLNIYQLVFATLCSKGAVNAAGVIATAGYGPMVKLWDAGTDGRCDHLITLRLWPP